MPKSVTFETTVTATGSNTGIVVPDEIIEQLAAGRRPSVLVSLNGYEYRNTVGVMGGRHLISVSAAAALAASEQASAFFGTLSNSMQRYHVDTINAAKSADTRQRRIDKAIALFLDGKQR
jgi:Bacteriocin-protection, YdeI or OmpD-Associated/Domain of unknown function (DUF1905)